MPRLATLLLAALVALPIAAQNSGQLKSEDIPKDFADKKPLDLEATASAAVLKGKGVFFLATTSSATTIATPPMPDRNGRGTTPGAPQMQPTSEPAPTNDDPLVVPLSAFVTYDVNATYDYADRDKRIADVSLRPSLLKGWFSNGDPFAGDLITRRSLVSYVDLRARNTTAPKDTTDDKKKSFFYGGVGLQIRQEFRKLLELESFTGMDFEQPTLAVTYYRKVSGDLPQDAPETGAIQARLNFDVAIPLTANLQRATDFRKKFADYLHEAAQAGALNEPLPEAPKRPTFPFSLSVELKASRPMEGASHKIERFADVALKMTQPGAKIGYLLRYRTGKDLGFEYDQKLLAGILLRLFE